jgi:hypothetical protein
MRASDSVWFVLAIAACSASSSTRPTRDPTIVVPGDGVALGGETQYVSPRGDVVSWSRAPWHLPLRFLGPGDVLPELAVPVGDNGPANGHPEDGNYVRVSLWVESASGDPGGYLQLGSVRSDGSGSLQTLTLRAAAYRIAKEDCCPYLLYEPIRGNAYATVSSTIRPVMATMAP